MEHKTANIDFPRERLERVLAAAYQLSRPSFPGAYTADALPSDWMTYFGKEATRGGLLHVGCVGGRALRLSIIVADDRCVWLGATRWMDHTQLELETLRDVALGAPCLD